MVEFLSPEAAKLREQGIIDKADPNNPIFVIRYNGVDYKVSLISVKDEHRDWMADNLSRMFIAAIANAEERGASNQIKKIHEALMIR